MSRPITWMTMAAMIPMRKPMATAPSTPMALTVALTAASASPVGESDGTGTDGDGLGDGVGVDGDGVRVAPLVPTMTPRLLDKPTTA